MSKDAVLTTVRALPLKPGVYLMRDANGSVIYVGKAKSLRKRVSSYFYHKNFNSPRLQKNASVRTNASPFGVPSLDGHASDNSGRMRLFARPGRLKAELRTGRGA